MDADIIKSVTALQNFHNRSVLSLPLVTTLVTTLVTARVINPKRASTYAVVLLLFLVTTLVTALVTTLVTARVTNPNRASTYAVVLFLLAGMCICSIVVPSRFIGQMVFL